jgi:dipeptidyl aminopeptidase/acylaminoacyl peptidase
MRLSVFTDCARLAGGGSLRAIMLALAGWVLLAAPAQAQRLLPVETFALEPQIADVTISPGGTHVAMTQLLANQLDASRGVTVYEIGAQNGRPVALGFDPLTVHSVNWIGDRRLLLGMTRRDRVHGTSFEFDRYHLVAMDLDGTNQTPLFMRQQAHILLWGLQYRSNEFVVNLYRVNVYTDDVELLERGTSDTRAFITDRKGYPRARIDSQRETGYRKLLVRRGNDPDWHVVPGFENYPGRAVAIYGFDADPNYLYLAARRGSDRSAIYRYDVRTGQRASTVFAHDAYDVSSFRLDPYTGTPLLVSYVDERRRCVYFDAANQSLQQALESTFPDMLVQIISSDRARERHIVVVSSPTEPGVYFYFDARTRHMFELAVRHPDILPTDLGEMVHITYTARDGVRIPAYLTYPVGMTPGKARNLPMVMMPHGGPELRDEWGYHYLAQFLANRGYLVLQPNFRGSSGYGAAFRFAGRQQWGLRMQDDVSDGVLHAVSTGLADPSRVCIVGGSYGGYAALAGMTLTPELYACGISINGLSDLPLILSDDVRRFGSDAEIVAHWRRIIGDRFAMRQQLEDTSPARLIHRIRAPIMFIHGEKDGVVPIRHSRYMARLMRQANIPHEFIEIKDGDHSLSDRRGRATALRAIERFLAEHLGGRMMN